MSSQLKEADKSDVEQIVVFLKAMSDELEEFHFNEAIVKESVTASFSENTYWFLFIDEDGNPFGTCYLQSVHNYWRLEKRFYLGGFFILPSHRGKGLFRLMNQKLVDWAKDHGGVQIYAHIHKDNQKSLSTFEAVGLEKVDYRLCVNHWGDK